MRHIPVLLNEVLDYLQLKPGVNVVDCTLGDAGHSEAILDKTAPEGKLLGIDADPESLLRAKRNLYRYGERVICVRDNFANLKKIILENNFGPVGAVLIDLGWSSPQFEERGRGFSFGSLSGADEPLDMRYGGSGSPEPTAADILNDSDEEELERIFKNYADEKYYREIAEAVVSRRKIKKIETVSELVTIILQVYKNKLGSDKAVPWIGGLHPATKVFQALRIAVNRELEVVKQALPQALDILAPGGRLAVITFHSAEDRIVKQYFRKIFAAAKIINKKPIVASAEELKANPRARSAKLRIIEKL